jgi:general secretion pathway protein F
MQFDYSARDPQGQEHKGLIEADDEGAAIRQLGADGLTPVRLAASAGSAARPAKASRQRVSAADQTVLLRELSTLLGAGVSLGDALPSLAQAYASQSLGPAMESLHTHVRGGGRLSEALEDARLRLPAFVLALTQAGEASGQLSKALSEAADQMELDRKVTEELRSALIYPTVLVLAGSLAVFIIFVGVVPRFASLIRGSRANVPELSRWVIESGLYVRTHLGEFGMGFGALAALIGYGASREALRHSALQTLIRIPGIGPWLIQSEIGRWATVLGTLLANRVPIVDAMGISARVLRLDMLRSGLERAARSLQQGQTLAASLESQGWFPPSRLNLIRVGERSGELPKMLLALGHSQTDAARLMQRRLLTLIEPVAILLIGAVIGVVMVAVMMAITSLNAVAV